MSIADIIQDTVDEMCNHYCKYSDLAKQMLEEEDTLENSPCDHCPLLDL